MNKVKTAYVYGHDDSWHGIYAYLPLILFQTRNNGVITEP